MPVFLPNLQQRKRLTQVHLTICNVGSRKLTDEDDYSLGGWRFFAPNLTVFGFDADPDACAQANSKVRRQGIAWKEDHVALAIGNHSGMAPLYVTSHPMCSSVYPPNEAFLERFYDLPDLLRLDHETSTRTSTLDQYFESPDLPAIDVLQIDAQGAALAVLQGAEHQLSEVLALQIEVEFSPMYVGQPLFSEVDSHLRERGFHLFDLNPSRVPRARSPIHSKTHPGQLLWGDAFYFRDPLVDTTAPELNGERIFLLACIADALEFSDFALELFEYVTLNYGAIDASLNLADMIVASLPRHPQMKGVDLASVPVVQRLREYLIDFDPDSLKMRK